LQATEKLKEIMYTIFQLKTTTITSKLALFTPLSATPNHHICAMSGKLLVWNWTLKKMKEEETEENNVNRLTRCDLLGRLDDLASARVSAKRATEQQDVRLGAVPLVMCPATRLLNACNIDRNNKKKKRCQHKWTKCASKSQRDKPI
jgi:hypothetical protein